MSEPVSDVEFYARSLDQHNTPWADGCARIMRAAEARATAAEERTERALRLSSLAEENQIRWMREVERLTGELAQVREENNALRLRVGDVSEALRLDDAALGWGFDCGNLKKYHEKLQAALEPAGPR